MCNLFYQNVKVCMPANIDNVNDNIYLDTKPAKPN